MKLHPTTTMPPHFSIIIPVYNVARDLRECLDSVQSQSFHDWEAICVDDGSTDGSGGILDEYAAKNSRFRVIHQLNTGVGCARNRALEMSSGSWLVFLDGDDLLAPDSLTLVRQAIERFPRSNLFQFGWVGFHETEQPDFCRPAPSIWTEQDISTTIHPTDYFKFFCQFVYRKTALNGRRFPRYIRGEDRLFLLSWLLDESAFVFTDTVCYGYRTRTGSAMHSIPSTQVLLDEMDHRIDAIRMIDESGKTVDYSGHVWLEKYFMRTFPSIAGRRKADRATLVSAWRERMKTLRSAKGFSRRGSRMVRLASGKRSFWLAWLICYWIPRIRGSIRFRLGRLKMALANMVPFHDNESSNS